MIASRRVASGGFPPPVGQKRNRPPPSVPFHESSMAPAVGSSDESVAAFLPDRTIHELKAASFRGYEASGCAGSTEQSSAVASAGFDDLRQAEVRNR